jgi:hypothetical protein
MGVLCSGDFEFSSPLSGEQLLSPSLFGRGVGGEGSLIKESRRGKALESRGILKSIG